MRGRPRPRGEERERGTGAAAEEGSGVGGHVAAQLRFTLEGVTISVSVRDLVATATLTPPTALPLTATGASSVHSTARTVATRTGRGSLPRPVIQLPRSSA